MRRGVARVPENVESQEAKARAWPKAMLARAILIYVWNGRILYQNVVPGVVFRQLGDRVILVVMPFGWE